jgi:hypothetical protein
MAFILAIISNAIPGIAESAWLDEKANCIKIRYRTTIFVYGMKAKRNKDGAQPGWNSRVMTTA